MKKLIFITAIAFSTLAFAQENKNEVKETTTTKTNVKDNTGTKVYKNDVTKTKTESLSLEKSDVNKTNQTATVKVKDIQINETYSNSGSNYMFEKEQNGYVMKNMSDSTDKVQKLIPSSRQGYYILYMAGQSSFGYFDTDGSFIVESYDPRSDAVIATKYLLLETGGIKPMRNTDSKSVNMNREEIKKNNKKSSLKE